MAVPRRPGPDAAGGEPVAAARLRRAVRHRRHPGLPAQRPGTHPVRRARRRRRAGRAARQRRAAARMRRPARRTRPRGHDPAAPDRRVRGGRQVAAGRAGGGAADRRARAALGHHCGPGGQGPAAGRVAVGRDRAEPAGDDLLAPALDPDVLRVGADAARRRRPDPVAAHRGGPGRRRRRLAGSGPKRPAGCYQRAGAPDVRRGADVRHAGGGLRQRGDPARAWPGRVAARRAGGAVRGGRGRAPATTC